MILSFVTHVNAPKVINYLTIIHPVFLRNHLSLFIPMCPALASSGGFKFYVSFVDDFSRFTWIYLLKHKSDVEQVFYNFQAHVERLLNAKIRAVQSDWGG